MRALYPLLYGPLREQHPCQSNSGCCFDNFLGLWGCSRKGSRRGGRNPTPMVALPNASAIFHKQNTEPNWQPLQTTSCFVNPVSVAISVPQSVLYGGSPVPRGLGGGRHSATGPQGGWGGSALRDAQAGMHTLQHATSAQSALWCANLSTDSPPVCPPAHAIRFVGSTLQAYRVWHHVVRVYAYLLCANPLHSSDLSKCSLKALLCAMFVPQRSLCWLMCKALLLMVISTEP